MSPYTYYHARYQSGDMRKPRATFIDDFEKLLADEFENSPTYFEIEEEYPVGSMTYRTIDARVTHAISNKMGVNLGDDWKTIMFPDPQYNAKLGTLYRFDSNIWLSYTTERIKGIATSIVVRRCNNVLRWMDDVGGIYQVPCVIDYPIRENRDYATAGSAIVNPAGVIEVYAPFNSQSNLIQPNQRFLFGNVNNWTAYKVVGGGVNNFANQQTLDNSTVGILRLTMSVNYVNDTTDDVTNGIADASHSIYTVDIQPTSAALQTGATLQLVATVYCDGVIVSDATVDWSTSNSAKATVSSTGLVTGIATGTCVISAKLTNNSSISDTLSLTVQSGAGTVYDVRITPTTNTILEGSDETFTVLLYKNGVVQADTFTITVSGSSTVPTDHYQFTATSGNTFVVYNTEKYVEAPLIISCVSTYKSINFNIFLAGVW